MLEFLMGLATRLFLRLIRIAGIVLQFGNILDKLIQSLGLPHLGQSPNETSRF